MRTMNRLYANRIASLTSVVVFLLVGFAPTGGAVQDVDLHDLTWYVHVDLVTGARPLSFWQSAIDQAEASANNLIEGGSGPFDAPCCARLGQDASVVTFGSPGDGYDVIDILGEESSLNGIFGGAGSNVFLVDSITDCGGSAAVGCAYLPGCSGNPNDDPPLWLLVTADAYDSGIFSTVLAHERGHNACLNHASAAGCQIMQGAITTPGNGGCFTSNECSNFRDARTPGSSGLECTCHASQGVLEADGAACAGVASGACSGGVCGDSSGDAGVKLVASAHPGSAGLPAPDDALAVSALTGSWTDLGQILPTGEDVQGLAYARDSSTLYGVIPSTGDDSIVTIDVDTGAVIATVGTIANGSSELISMAYNPGATSGTADDRLIMLEVSGTSGTVVWVDPASASTKNVYGTIVWAATLFTGLAYDSNQGMAFASTPFGPDGLYMIDLTTCPPSPCTSSQVPGAGLFVDNGSLAFSPESGNLYQLGTAFSGTRTFYNIIDPVTGTSVETLNIDVATPGGLAAVPEPAFGLGLVLGCAGLTWASRRRGASR